VSTTHVAIFRIENQSVMVRSFSVIYLDEGDEVKLAGQMKKGVFQADAYRNLTTSAEGNRGVWVILIAGIAVILATIGGSFTGCGGLLFMMAYQTSPPLFLLLVGIDLLLTGIGIYVIRVGLRIRQAVQILSRSTNE